MVHSILIFPIWNISLEKEFYLCVGSLQANVNCAWILESAGEKLPSDLGEGLFSPPVSPEFPLAFCVSIYLYILGQGFIM